MQYKNGLAVSSLQMRRISEEFNDKMDTGLEHSDSELLMLPTQTGECYGIHISGSEVQIVFARLSDVPHRVDLVQTYKIPIPDALRSSTAENFFKFVADHVLTHARSIGRTLTDKRESAVFGLAFSFPCQHSSLQSGTIMKWTKGFDVSLGDSKDPAEWLESALKSKGINATVEALVNDTVAEICLTRYVGGESSEIGIALDTGSNASYVEDGRRIAKMDCTQQPLSEEDVTMVVNTEWPGFSPNAYRLLGVDRELDGASYRPGDQPFEKLTGHLYLGEITRRILLRVAEAEGWPLFQDCVGNNVVGAVKTQQMKALAEDESVDLRKVGELMQDLFGTQASDYSLPMRRQAKTICCLILARSAKLVAAAIWGILKHMHETPYLKEEEFKNNVSVDGKLYRSSEVYQESLGKALQDLADGNHVQILELEDSAAFGAATLAAASRRQKRNSLGLGDSL